MNQLSVIAMQHAQILTGVGDDWLLQFLSTGLKHACWVNWYDLNCHQVKVSVCDPAIDRRSVLLVQ